MPDLIEHTLPDSHKLDTLTKYLPLTRRTEVCVCVCVCVCLCVHDTLFKYLHLMRRTEVEMEFV